MEIGMGIQEIGKSPHLTQFRIEFSGISAYAKDADEFVRLERRDRTGWRRDEWAQSPLFIWLKGLAAGSFGCRSVGRPKASLMSRFHPQQGIRAQSPVGRDKERAARAARE
jgi:hypothetical protein